MKRVHVLIAGAFSLALSSWNLYGGAVMPAMKAMALEQAVDGSASEEEAVDGSVSTVGLDFSSDDTFDFESDEFQALLKQLQAHIEGLKAQMPEDQQHAFAEMEMEMKTLGDKLNTLRAEAAEFAHKKAAHKQEVQELRAQLAQLEQDKAELTATVARLEAEAMSDDELAQKQAELAQMDATITETANVLALKRAEKREVKTQLQAHEAEIQTIERQMDTQSEFDFGQLFTDMPDEDPSATFEANELASEDVAEGIETRDEELPSGDEFTQEMFDSEAVESDVLTDDEVPADDEVRADDSEE
jgi:chromosome segregation ATPase